MILCTIKYVLIYFVALYSMIPLLNDFPLNKFFFSFYKIEIPNNIICIHSSVQLIDIPIVERYFYILLVVQDIQRGGTQSSRPWSENSGTG